MKATELIKRLEEMMETGGDFEIYRIKTYVVNPCEENLFSFGNSADKTLYLKEQIDWSKQ